MNEFRYLSYHTRYSSEGDTPVRLGNYACFSSIFHDRNGILNNYYEIVLYTDINNAKENYNNNYCPFSEKLINRHIHLLTYLFPIKWRLSTDDDTIIVHVELKGIKMYHLYALAWIRYLYEFPYNMILMDAYNLKSNKLFTFTSIETLFNLISANYENQFDGLHALYPPEVHIPMKIKQLRKKLETVNRLHDIFNSMNTRVWQQPDVPWYSPYDVEFWSDEFYPIRETCYIDYYLNFVKRK